VTHTAALPELTHAVDHGFTDLLVAYDFSAAAGIALEYATELSRHLGSTVHLISVETPAECARVMSGEPRARENVHEHIRRAFDNIETRLRAKGIQCDSAHRVGEVSDTLEGAILEDKTDLLLLGAFGHGPTDRKQLGSTAEHILRVARCPVLTIGPHAVRHTETPPKIDRLVCVTNPAIDDHQFLIFCGKLAAAVHGCLEILQVVDPEDRAYCKKLERHCEARSRTLRGHGIDVSWTLLYGAPEVVIPARAAELKAGLILIGVDRTGSPAEAALDPAVIAAIRTAHCPVLVIPADEWH